MGRLVGLTTTEKVQAAQLALEQYLAASQHAASGMIATGLRKWVSLTDVTVDLLTRRHNKLLVRRKRFAATLTIQLANIGSSNEDLVIEVRRFGRRRVRVTEPARSGCVSWVDSNGVRFINRSGATGADLVNTALALV